MLTGQKIIEYLAKQCSLPDVESSSHWDYYHRNFSFESEKFFGLEGFGNEGKNTTIRARLAHKILQIPFVRMGTTLEQFPKFQNICQNICKKQGKAYTLDVLRQALSLAFVDSFLSDISQKKSFACVIGDGFGAMSCLLLQSRYRKGVVIANLTKTLLVDLWYIRLLKGHDWFERNVVLLTEDNFKNNTRIDLSDYKVVGLEAKNASLIGELEIDLFFNTVSMQEMPRRSIEGYFEYMRRCATKNPVFLYCCNRLEKTHPDGAVIKFFEYPWLDDLVIVDELCPWHQYYYGKGGFPIYKKYDGPIWHRLCQLSSEKSDV
jgi:hypothetical protein